MIYYLNQMTLFKNPQIQSCTKEDIEEYLNSVEEFGLDTETSGLDPFTDKLLVIVLGDAEKQFFIDARDKAQWEFLIPYLESSNWVKILANAGFDYKFLKQNGVVMNKVFDVITADLALSQDGKNFMSGLADLVGSYLREYMDKSERNSFIGMDGEPFMDSQVFYACDDIKFLPALKSELTRISIEMKSNVLNLENAMSLVIADMELEGVKLDIDAWEALAESAKAHRAAAEEKLDAIVMKDEALKRFQHKYIQADMFTPFDDLRKVNVLWSSPKQVLNVMKTIVPTLESVDAEDLSEHRSKHELIETYLNFSEWGKKATTYGYDFLNHLHHDGRIRTQFMPIVSTGRMSSRNPNMQNIPAENAYRNCFIPNYEGWDFVSSDFSSQELCIIAYGAQDPVWLKAMEEGKDLHSICAELLFKQRWEKARQPECDFYREENGEAIKQKCNCKGHKKLRDVVKTLNFGLAYGLTEHSFSARMGISVENARNLIKDYYTAFPAIEKYMKSLSQFAKNKGFMLTMHPFFRVRKFKNWKGYYTTSRDMASIERQGKNTRIQGTGADMLKLALVLTRQYIIQNNLCDKVKLVLTVHDELNTICKSEYSDTWKEELKGIMEKAARAIVPSGLIKAEPTVSKKWEK
jgi:DNA polymerase I